VRWPQESSGANRQLRIESNTLMKKIMVLIAALLPLMVSAQEQKPTTLKGVLLEQLRTTHNVKDWYVPVTVAVDGITAEQANWTDGKGNHSVGQLAYHLLFWDRRALVEFKGEDPGKFSGNNEETFNNFDSKQWSDTVRQLDQVLTDWEKAVEAADDAKLSKGASLIAHVGAHNAYHIGQIVFVRKEQGSWDPAKGVK
jgi:uncharacterized damage-inducible protein DinB